MKSFLGPRGRRTAVAAAAIFAVIGGIAYAAIPDAGTGTYHACMLKSIGTIRIIDPAKQSCSATLETEITFNQKGPKGDQELRVDRAPPAPTARTGLTAKTEPTARARA